MQAQRAERQVSGAHQHLKANLPLGSAQNARHGGGGLGVSDLKLDDIIIELSARNALGLAVLVVLLVIPLGVSLMPRNGEPEKTPPLVKLQKQMGLEQLNGGWFFLATLLWGALFGTLIMGLLSVLWGLITDTIPNAGDTDAIWDWRFAIIKLTALTATLGAVVAFPFTLIRLNLIRRQTASSEASLELETVQFFEERLEKALKNMSSRYEHKWRERSQSLSKEEANQVTEWSTFSETRENIELRVAGISQLEGIAREGQKAWLRVRSLLNGFVTQNAPISTASINPRRYYEELKNQGGSDVQILDRYGVSPDIEDTEYMWEWLAGIKMREDINQALQVLGRLQSKYNKTKNTQHVISILENIDIKNNLSNLNLQKAFLQNADLSDSNFEFTALEGATVQDSQLNRCNFQKSKWNGSQVIFANFDDSDFTHCNWDLINWQHSSCLRAKFQSGIIAESDLVRLDCSHANFNYAHFISSQLCHVKFKRCQLVSSRFTHCHLDACIFDECEDFSTLIFAKTGLANIDLREIDVTQEQIDQCFGDKSVKLPKHIKRPANWPDWDLGSDLNFQEYVKWRSLSNPSEYVAPDNPS